MHTDRTTPPDAATPLRKQRGRPFTAGQSGNHQALRTAFAESSLGATAGAELYRHVADVAATGARFDPNDTMTALRNVWGSQTDTRISAVQAAIQRAAVRAPGILNALNQTGAGNDPALIRKIYAGLSAAQKRGK